MDVDFKKFKKEIEVDDPRVASTAPVPIGGGMSRVKDKRAARIQVTAEQILRVAHENQERYLFRPQRRIEDKEELEDYFLSKRTDFEKRVAKNRFTTGKWLQYAHWEESMHEFERSRSVFERCIDVDPTDPNVYMKYAEMEMRHKFINHARNILDRATALLPRVDRLWLKYVYLEELVGNVTGARAVFERWLKWLPPPFAFKAYIKMELRYKEVDKARAVFERLVRLHPTGSSWLRYARFERKHASSGPASVICARRVFQRAVEAIGPTDEKIFIEFARFEEDLNEVERARVIYKFALDKLPRAAIKKLYHCFVSFEKKNGDREDIQEVILSKKRHFYEEEIKRSPEDYDAWFDYIALEEDACERMRGKVSEMQFEAAAGRVRELYERAIGQPPPVAEKRYWRRYVYFWIKYALFEEMLMKDYERTLQIYRKVLEIVPHSDFSFSKLWVLCAKFLLRRGRVAEARKVFGNAIGTAPKEKIFEEYVKMEILLGNIDRVRVIYQRFLEFDSSNSEAWIQYALLEKRLGDLKRARGIFELGVQQEVLDMPEGLWKAYIDFEIDNKENEFVRALYRRLLEKSQHVKVWISFAEFEIKEAQDIDAARKLFAEADSALRSRFQEQDPAQKKKESGDESLAAEIDRKEQRVALLLRWKAFEANKGDGDSVANVEKKMPRRVKRRRRIVGADGEAAGFEEYFDYIFRDDESAQVERNRLLEIAHRWKQRREEESDSDSDSDSDSGSSSDDDSDEDSDDDVDDGQDEMDVG